MNMVMPPDKGDLSEEEKIKKETAFTVVQLLLSRFESFKEEWSTQVLAYLGVI